ncbi:hypothetical protein OKW34_001565 [Paraburkholderia youngii]
MNRSLAALLLPLMVDANAAIAVVRYSACPGTGQISS